ncbi:uncharacterized protein LOC110699733 [Chenopodium quinoa]|uniref:uncharacterized protein LOC110699733 n=1 Tax=Chenopodium quinoa TaxID=63459 RepID=UPI000B7955FF|nr:uncharacterized protein LOC110699733 [Chenopodium quinoa]
MNAPKVDKVKMPTIEPFAGTTNPDEHLAAYAAQMSVQTSCEATLCKYFPTTLKGQALLWFQKCVPKGSIHSYQNLERVFVSRFKHAASKKKTSVNLMAVTQGKTETLQNYIRRFNQEYLKIQNLPDETALTAFLVGLSSSDFKFKLIESGVSTLTEAMERAHKNIQAPEVCGTSRENNPPKKKRKHENEPSRSQPSKRSNLITNHGNDPRYNRNRRQIYLDIKEKNMLPRPPVVRTPEEKRDKRHWCEFNRECGHTT